MAVMKLFHLLSFVAASHRDGRHYHEVVLHSVRGGGRSNSESSTATTDVTMIPNVETPQVWSNGPKRAIILMDRFAEYHGFYLQRMALEVYGVAVVTVLSDYMRGYFLQNHPELDEPKTLGVPSEDHMPEWIEKIGVSKIEGIICESDSGLAEAERFGSILKLAKQNGINEARRNKYLMNQVVSQAGLPVVNQKLCASVEEAVEFATALGVSDGNDSVLKKSHRDETDTLEIPTGLLGSGRNTDLVGTGLCIVKPIRGVASDSVFLCHNIAEVKEAFHNIYDQTIFGTKTDKHDSVLVQEFASGTEYALDIVSKNGEHKIAAMWRYDKRPSNGRSFVYHATELIDSQTPEAESVCDYASSVLNALDIKWGTAHTEVIMTNNGCRLVEVNCRHHNMDFAPLTMACIGYNSLDMLLSAYLGDGGCAPGSEEMCLEWKLLPERPVLRAFGAMVHLVNHVQGRLLGVNEDALREIQGMESVFDLQVYPHFLEVGNIITPTIDIRSDAGWVQMINDDPEAFLRDYNRIVELMPLIFFVEQENR